MKDYEVMLKELDEKDYTLLRFNIGENNYGPFESIVRDIKSVLSDPGFEMEPVSKPSIITITDKIDGMYLVNEDHIHTSVYMRKGDNWFKIGL